MNGKLHFPGQVRAKREHLKSCQPYRPKPVCAKGDERERSKPCDIDDEVRRIDAHKPDAQSQVKDRIGDNCCQNRRADDPLWPATAPDRIQATTDRQRQEERASRNAEHERREAKPVQLFEVARSVERGGQNEGGEAGKDRRSHDPSSTGSANPVNPARLRSSDGGEDAGARKRPAMPSWCLPA